MAKEMAQTMGIEFFKFIEKALDNIPKFHQFDMPQLSQETPARPALQPHFSVPGPAAEGPAKPGISGNNVPFNTEMHGAVDDMTLIKYSILSPRRDQRGHQRPSRRAGATVARQRPRRLA
eukprot:8888243-Pyramimonas_sp.AAC.1